MAIGYTGRLTPGPGVIITIDLGIDPANRSSWVLLKRCGLQVTEVRIPSASDCQFRGAVTSCTSILLIYDMFVMSTGIPAVVLRSPFSVA